MLGAIGGFSIACVVPACGSRDVDHTVSITESVTGSNASVVPFPAAIAVGRVNTPEGPCTGTLVDATVVLTAIHCFCGTSSAFPTTFCIDTRAGTPGTCRSVAAVTHLVDEFSCARIDEGTVDRASTDVSVLELFEPFSAEELGGGTPMPVLIERTAGLSLFGEFAAPGALGFERPFAFIGYAGTSTKRVAIHEGDVEYDPVLPLTAVYQSDVDADVATTQGGDSGGPLLASLVRFDDEGRPESLGRDVQIGVLSGKGTLFSGFNVLHAATSALATGSLIRSFITDGDQDGVVDAADNCPAIQNIEQEDEDDDGVGDACDLCARADVPSGASTLRSYSPRPLCFDDAACAALGAGTCDRRGDVERVCAALSSGAVCSADSDCGAGARCLATGTPSMNRCSVACSSDVDCAGEAVPARESIVQCLRGECAEIPRVLTSEGGPTCFFDDSDCTEGADQRFRCVGASGASEPILGRCTGQADRDADGFADSCDTCPVPRDFGVPPGTFPIDALDADSLPSICDNCPEDDNADQADQDGDGRGDACDSCPGIESHVQSSANSNAAIERALSAAPLIDACDPVPVLSAAPRETVVTLFGASDTVAFDTRRVLGLDQARAENDQIGSVAARTGFGHCSCFIPFAALQDPEACLNSACRPETAVFGQSSPFRPISTTFRGAPVAPGASSVASYSQTGMQCGQPGGSCEVGTGDPLGLTWHWRDDATAGRVTHFPTNDVGGIGTNGFLWTFAGVRDGAGALTFASGRDLISQGALRSHFVHVKTPFERLQLPPLPPIPPPIGPSDDGCPQCAFVLRTDLLAQAGNPSILGLPGIPLRAALTGDRVFAYAGGGNPPIDLGTLSSPSLVTLLSSARQFMTPVEPTLSRSLGIVGAALPRAFAQGTVPDVAIVLADGTIGTFDQVGEPPGDEIESLMATVAAPAEAQTRATYSPNDRADFASILSASEANIYMLGGRRPTGARTGQIWRFSIVDGVWSPVLGTYSPAHVLAATYTPATTELYVLDEVTVERPGRARPHSRVLLRLSVVDSRTGDGVELGRWPRAGLFDRFALGVLPDQSLVAVGSSRVAGRWVAARFTSAAGKLRVLGITHGKAPLIDAIIASPAGVTLMLSTARGTAVKYVTLGPRDFALPNGRHCPWEDRW